MARKPTRDIGDDQLDPTQNAEVDENESDTNTSDTDKSDETEDDEQQVPEPDDGLPAPTEAELDAADALDKRKDADFAALIVESQRKFIALATAYATTTPDEHVIMGIGSHKITVGDVRRLAIGFKRKYRGQ